MSSARKSTYPQHRLACGLLGALAGQLLGGCVPPPASRPAPTYAALDRVREHAANCQRPGQPEGSGVFVVTFGPDGAARTASVRGGSLAGTSTADCVLGLLRAERIARGEPEAVAREDRGLDDNMSDVAAGWVTVGVKGGVAGAPFDRGGAAAELGARSQRAERECGGAATTMAPGHVTVYFAQDGMAVAAIVDGGSPTVHAAAPCIERILAGSRVAPFGGKPIAVGKSSTLGLRREFINGLLGWAS